MLVANPDVPCLRNLQRLIDAVKAGGCRRRARSGSSSIARRSSACCSTVADRARARPEHRLQREQRLPHGGVGGELRRAGLDLRASELTGQLEAIAGRSRAAAERSPAYPRTRSLTTVAPRCDSGASQNRSTSACSRSRRWMAARCTPLPRPWISRTPAVPLRRAASQVVVDDRHDVPRCESMQIDASSIGTRDAAHAVHCRGHLGGDAAARGEVADHRHPPRRAGGHQVVEDLVGRRLVEDALVAELEQVVLQGLQLDARASGT